MEQEKNPDVYVLTYRQEELSWRLIVFLPFNFAWRMLMAVLACLYFTVIIYMEVFLGTKCLGGGIVLCNNTLSVVTLCHSVDILLSILHRTWGPVQKSMAYQPKTLFNLIVDIIAVIPFRELINGELYSDVDKSINWLQMVRLLGCLRVYRVFIELIGLKQIMWLNPIVVCLLQQNAMIASLVLVLCSAWYLIGVLNEQNPKSWLDDLTLAELDVQKSSSSDMYLFSFVYVLALFLNELVADVRPLNMYEICFITITIYVGAFFQYNYVLGSLMQSCLKNQEHMYKIKNFIRINRKCLHDKRHKELVEYYNMFWNNWSGLHKCPMLGSFPLCLQKDVMTDVYWDAIEHSHVLRHFPLNIKRHLSLFMQSKFMQPGDHLFRKGELRSSYFYIATGIVQIMSHYDGVSPIMTISSGSCLGSRSLTLLTDCPTDVICATECEVRFLTFKDFHTALSSYMNGSGIAHTVERQHIAHIKRMYVLSKAYNFDDPYMRLYGVSQDDKLNWIKYRWRSINNVDMDVLTQAQMKQIEDNYLGLLMTHTSKFLDAIVLGKETKWAADRCCIRTSCPYILDPDCDFVTTWLSLMVILITIDCVCLPFCAAFLYETPTFMVMWDNIIFFTYIFDIYIQLVTATKLVDKTIVEPMPLLRHRLKNIMFLIDIVATLPVRQLFRLFVDEAMISPYIVLPRLLKIVRVYTFFKIKYNYITASTLLNHVIKYIYLSFFTGYFAACFFFIFSCHFDKQILVCNNRSWFSNMAFELKFFKMTPGENTLDYIIMSLYRILKFVYSSGLNSSVLILFKEILFACFLVCISRNLIMFVYAELIAMWMMRRHRKLIYENLVKSLKVVLNQKHIHPGLINMIESYIQLEWRYNNGVDLNLEEAASEIVTPILKNDQYLLIINSINKIPLINELNAKCYYNLVKAFRVYRVPKGYIFCRSGESPTSFNVIIKGVCKLTSMLKEDTIEHPNGKLIGPGKSFPLFETIQNIDCLQTTVSVTACKVAAIDVDVFKDLIFSSDDYWEELIAMCPLETNPQLDVIKSKVKYRKVKTPTPNFIPRLRNKPKPGKDDSCYCLIFALINNPPFVINPHGTFMLVWESIKCLQVLASLLYIPYMFNLICHNYVSKYLVALLLDLISLSDVVLRFYLGNYNKKGVLVNPNGYYLSHSFFVDFLSSLPIYLLIRNKEFSWTFFFSVIPKILQMYRLSGYILVLQSRLKIPKVTMLLIFSFTHILLLVYLLAHCVYVSACTSSCDDRSVFQVKCNSNSWISGTSYYRRSSENKGPVSLLFLFANLIVFIVLGNDQGSVTVMPVHEMKLILLFVVVITILRAYFIPMAVTYTIGHYQNFTKHRDNHRLFWEFINNEGGNKSIAQRIYNHFVFLYLKMKGIEINKFIPTLHPSIQYDLTFGMYYKGMLCLHWFVGPSKAFIKRLCNKVKELQLKGDTPVLRFNEVNYYIYFICEGHVNLFNTENERVRTLGPGSMFGSFKIVKGTRHKVMYKTKYNCQLLQIATAEFFAVLRLYNQQIYDDFIDQITNKEYVNFAAENEEHSTEEYQYVDKFETLGIMNHSSASYKWTMFFLSMIVPYLTMFPVLISIAASHYTNYTDRMDLLIMLYTLDFISLARIILGLNTTYTDEMSGIHVTDLKRIRLEYLLNPSHCFLDVFTLLPIEVFGYLIVRRWIPILKLNRVGRLIIMLQYMTYYRERTYVRIWLRWFEFISFVTLAPLMWAALWIYFTCKNGCSIIYNMKVVVVTDTYGMLVYSLYEVVNLMTFSTSYEMEKPWNVTECVVVVIISVSSFVVMPLAIAKFVQTSIMSNYNQRAYEYNTYCMKIYLQLRDLSASLLERLWTYALLLYTTNNGHDLPLYVASAPMSMRCELFYDLYGGHLKYNLLFDECNHDLIFQLSGLLRRTVYFPGDFIIRKLDVDGRMYFINSGEVEELEYDDMNTEDVKEVYITGHCFGLAQGLYERTPHLSNYKARTMVEVLSLQRSDWLHLVDCFPEDVKSIFKMARRLSLDSF